MHLSFMGSLQAYIGYIGINTMDTAESTRITKSRPWLQGQRSQDRNCMPMHIYPSWVVPMHKLVTLASILWVHECPQNSQGQGHDPKVKVQAPHFHAHAHPPLVGIDTSGTGRPQDSQSHSSKVKSHRTKIPYLCTSPHHELSTCTNCPNKSGSHLLR